MRDFRDTYPVAGYDRRVAALMDQVNGKPQPLPPLRRPGTQAAGAIAPAHARRRLLDNPAAAILLVAAALLAFWAVVAIGALLWWRPWA